MSFEDGAILDPTYGDAVFEDRLRRTTDDRALRGLDGSGLAERFRSWRGRSGRRYVFSVFRDSAGGGSVFEPAFPDAVVIAASRKADGTRRIVHVTATDSCPELFFQGRALAEARADGATELHIHLLASSKSERRAIVDDLLMSA